MNTCFIFIFFVLSNHKKLVEQKCTYTFFCFQTNSRCILNVEDVFLNGTLNYSANHQCTTFNVIDFFHVLRSKVSIKHFTYLVYISRYLFILRSSPPPIFFYYQIVVTYKLLFGGCMKLKKLKLKFVNGQITR